ncbi:uncharacterized protein JCM15063_003785 [Sporobolomyces koalae]|uniref:uncharacterized protein n=1 Tax=Sporobolomyces koalae TaxID=500713 RepID=UPI00316F3B29
MQATDASFVLVDHSPPPNQEQLRALAEYFPSLAKPSTFAFHDVAVRDRVRARRQQCPDGRLFVDELLALAGLDGPASYPPESPNAFQSTIVQILASPTLSSLNISSILYYFALATAPTTAAAFAENRLLPPEFALSIRAFHALDQGQYDLAIRLLSDPRIRQPDFVTKTITLVAQCSEPKERHRLVLAYWRLTGIPWQNTQGRLAVDQAELIVRALCDPQRKRGALEAWELARTWSQESEIERLMRAILAACFGDNHSRLPVPQHLQSLLAFPFTRPEIALLTSFSLSPPSSLPTNAHSLAVDWFLSLLISSSKPLEALVFYHKLKHTGKLEPSEDRDRLLRALEDTLTKSQKTSLAIEIAAQSANVAAKPTAAAQPTASSSSSSVTQPAWAPLPDATPSTPKAVPRTLAAARQSKLPPPASPAPKPTDLPLSASPFVRKDAASGQGLIKALKEQQLASRQSGSLAATATASPARVRSGTLPVPRTNVTDGGSQYSFVSRVATETGGSGSFAGGEHVSTPVKSKPTLAGFGSVRQQPQSTPNRFPSSSMQEIDMHDDLVYEQAQDQRQQANAHDDDEEMMLVPASSTPPAKVEANTEDDFSRRITLDPAIQKTLLAASTSKLQQSNSTLVATSSSSSTAKSTQRTPKRTRGTSQNQRGDDKRRAVSSEPEVSQRNKPSSNTKASSHPREPASIPLPPGAFPGSFEEQPEERPSSSSSSRNGSQVPPEMKQVRESSRAVVGTRRSSTTKKANDSKSGSRRSSRARSTSVVPQQEEEEDHADEGDQDESEKGRGTKGQLTPPRRRRSSRASSLQPPEMSEVSKPTPVRRSSRLKSGNASTATGKSGDGTAPRRSTRRSQNVIEEEEDHDDAEEDE